MSLITLPVKIQSLYKLGDGASEDQPWNYSNLWATDDSTGVRRLVIAPRSSYVDLIDDLLGAMSEPMWLLYVLVVPRGEGEPGRYQSSEPKTREEVRQFLREFKEFLETDGRQNLWIRSESGEGMLVYDRHNLIYAYSPLEQWRSLLKRVEMNEVESGVIEVPDPHSHHYHPAFDTDAQRILEYMDWNHTVLREHDQR